MRALLAIGCLGLATAGAAVAAPFESAEAICFRVEPQINLIADSMLTKCLPTMGKSPGRVSFVVIASGPVLSDERTKKGWMMLACAAIGKQLNENQAVLADEIWMSDSVRSQQHIAFALPAETCKTVQKKLAADAMSLEQGFAVLRAATMQKGPNR